MGIVFVVVVDLPGYDVVMATYNGAQYLDQQLETIVAQSLPPLRILIVDDGSNDETSVIVRRWKKSQDIPIELVRCDGRFGACKTFERALLAATADYVMPADQDDLWDLDKAELLMREMVRLEQCRSKATPILVHTALRLINQDGLPLGGLFHQRVGLNPRQDRWPTLALQNVVTGCASVVNRSCLRLALPFPDHAVLHDWWLALIAKRFGCLAYLERPTVSYRQHAANVVGAQSFLVRLKKNLLLVLHGKKMPGQLIVPALAQMQAFLRVFASQLSPGEQAHIRNLCHPSLVKRIHAALSLQLQKQGLMRTAAFYACLAWPGPLPLRQGQSLDPGCGCKLAPR